MNSYRHGTADSLTAPRVEARVLRNTYALPGEEDSSAGQA
jgi:hypothetical protein